MSERKLSELMEAGATRTQPIGGDAYRYSDKNGEYACALGCALYAVYPAKISFTNDELRRTLNEVIGFDVIDERISTELVPADCRPFVGQFQYAAGSIGLSHLIVRVSDNISRDRAIQLVKELGY